MEGVFSIISDTILVESLNDPVKMEIQQGSNYNIEIKFKGLVNGHAYEKISGNYKPTNSLKPHPILSPQSKSGKWDDLIVLANSKVNVLSFPSPKANGVTQQISKGETVSCYRYLFTPVNSSESFLFVEWKGNRGWITADFFNSHLLKIFKCERLPNGTIEKDNRREKYIIYTDVNGKTLRKENY